MTAAKIKTGLEAYLKSTTYVEAETTAQEGKFHISISDTDSSWWLTYTLPKANLQIAKILANRALQEGFVSAVDKEAGKEDDKYVATTTTTGDNPTTSMNKEVWYQVR